MTFDTADTDNRTVMSQYVMPIWEDVIALEAGIANE